MNALHYAVFFDVPDIVKTLLEHKPGEKRVNFNITVSEKRVISCTVYST